MDQKIQELTDALTGIDNGQPIPYDLEEKLQILGLIEKVQTQVEMTQKGREFLAGSEVITREVLKNFHDVLGTSPQEGYPIGIQLGIENLASDSPIAKYFLSLDERKRNAYMRVAEEFFRLAESLIRIHGTSARHVTIQPLNDHTIQWTKVGQFRKLLVSYLTKRTALTGNSSYSDQSIIFIQDDLLDIEYELYTNSETKGDLQFLGLRYIMTGESHSRIEQPMLKANKSRTDQHLTIKQRLARARGTYEASYGNLEQINVLFLQMNNSSENERGNFLALSRFLTTHKRRGETNYGDETFTRFAKMLIIGIHPQHEKLRQSFSDKDVRTVGFEMDQIPRFLHTLLAGQDELKKVEVIHAEDFAAQVLSFIQFQGVSTFEHFRADVKKAMGKFTVASIFLYTLRYSPELEKEILLNLLEVLIRSDDKNIGLSEEVEQLLEKHGLSKDDRERVRKIFIHYKPDILLAGALVSGIDIETELPKAIKLVTDDIGVKQETDKLIHALTKHSIVSLVDNTGYSAEILTDRMRHSLAHRIMTGDVPDCLKMHSIYNISIKEKGLTSFLEFLLGQTNTQKDVQIEKIERALKSLARYNYHGILFLSLPKKHANPERYKEMENVINRFGLKLVIVGSERIPGSEAYLGIAPKAHGDVKIALLSERLVLQKRLGIAIPEEAITSIVARVSGHILIGENPIETILRVIQHATIEARSKGLDSLDNKSITSGIAFVKGLTNPEQTETILATLKDLPAYLGQEIRGQQAPIKSVVDMIEFHISGGTNPEKPLSIMLPGPTGVGKTMLAETIARYLNIPSLTIDGSHYKEEHAKSRLTGSPPGYVGEQEGILTKFMQDNTAGLVFIDELDKMHPEVRDSLMNFIDKGYMANGAGLRYHRPKYIVITATNAGADRLNTQMSKGDIISCIADAFKDANGKAKPEFAGRFEIIPMFGIGETPFRESIETALFGLNERPILSNKDARIVSITPDVVDLLYKECVELCSTFTEATSTIGFHQAPAKKSTSFFNLREIDRAISRNTKDILSGISEPGEYRLMANEDGKIEFEKV